MQRIIIACIVILNKCSIWEKERIVINLYNNFQIVLR